MRVISPVLVTIILYPDPLQWTKYRSPTSSDPNDKPPPSDTQSIPILPEPSDVSSSSYVIALDEDMEPPTTHEESIQHEGKTLQQMIDEGAGSFWQNPIDVDQFRVQGCHDIIQLTLTIPTPMTPIHMCFVCSHNNMTTHWPKLWGEINNCQSNPSHGVQVIHKSGILEILLRG